MEKPGAKKSSKSYQKSTIWLAVLASILLIITNSAIWLNNQIFDTENFSNTATQSLTSEESRNAIATGLTDRAFEGRPVLRNVVGDVPVNIVGGLLGTDQAEKGIDKVVSKFHVMVTSEKRESISLELTGIKSVLNQLYDTVTNLGREPKIDPSKIPDEIVLVESGMLPNFYKATVAFLWLAPLAFIGAFLALAYPYFKNPKQYRAILAIQGAIVAFAGLMALSAGPLFKPPLLSNVQTGTGRIVVENLYDAFIATFNTQSLYLFGIGAVALAVSGGLYVYQLVSSKKK